MKYQLEEKPYMALMSLQWFLTPYNNMMAMSANMAIIMRDIPEPYVSIRSSTNWPYSERQGSPRRKLAVHTRLVMQV